MNQHRAAASQHCQIHPSHLGQTRKPTSTGGWVGEIQRGTALNFYPTQVLLKLTLEPRTFTFKHKGIGSGVLQKGLGVHWPYPVPPQCTLSIIFASCVRTGFRDITDITVLYTCSH